MEAVHKQTMNNYKNYVGVMQASRGLITIALDAHYWVILHDEVTDYDKHIPIDILTHIKNSVCTKITTKVKKALQVEFNTL